MPKVIVTGSSGFLGQYVVRSLHEKRWQVFAVDRTPAVVPSGVNQTTLELPSRSWDERLLSVRPEALVHLAGPASVPASVRDPAADFEGSVRVWYACLDSARRLGDSCRIVYASSAAVYGDPSSLPVREADGLRPVSPYGLNKLLCETAMERFHALYGLRVAAVRIFSAYGAGLRRQLVWDVCRKAMSAPAVELWGTGNESRDFVYASDVALGIGRVLERGAFHGESYNLAMGCGTTVRELAERLMRHLSVEKPLHFSGEARPGDLLHWRADISRISALGFRPEIDIDRGLGLAAAWAREQAS